MINLVKSTQVEDAAGKPLGDFDVEQYYLNGDAPVKGNERASEVARELLPNAELHIHRDGEEYATTLGLIYHNDNKHIAAIQLDGSFEALKLGKKIKDLQHLEMSGELAAQLARLVLDEAHKGKSNAQLFDEVIAPAVKSLEAIAGQQEFSGFIQEGKEELEATQAAAEAAPAPKKIYASIGQRPLRRPDGGTKTPER